MTVLGDVPAPKQAKTSTLALENRPKTWGELVGQPIPVTVLVNSLALGDIKPGYVFTGTTGTGKTSAAILLAKRLNCEAPNLVTQDPCNVCHSCLTVDRGTNFDVKFVDGAADRSIEFVRSTLKPFLTTAPRGKCRVVIVDEAHQYGKDAISAFLTLLENMPRFAGKSVVIMTTTEGDKMASAILNRCMNLHFSAIPNDMLADKMAVYTGEDRAALALLAQESGNSFRTMWSYIEVWQHLGEPLTNDVVMKLIGGVGESERKAMWSDLSNKKVDRIGDRWRKWLQTGARPEVIGALLIRDLISWAAAVPATMDWHKPLVMLSGAEQVGSDNAWLQALYLMVGLPLDIHTRHCQEPEEGQSHKIPAGIDPVLERLLFFGA